MRVIAREPGRSRSRSQSVTLERPVQIDSGIPDGRRIVLLRSLCLATELTDPTKSPDIPFQYVDVSAVSNELWKITASTEHLGSTAPSRARKLVRANDVIFATVRPILKRVAMVPDHLDGQIVSTAFCVLRANPTQADSRFIYYSLLTDEFLERVGNLQRGASYPAVTDGDVLGQEVLVPPLPEQRAIAAVLGKIQAAVEVQEKIVATLKELKAATMAKLFREGLRGEPLKQTEIGEIPESWEIVKVGDLFTVELGKMLSPKSKRGIKPRPYIRNKNVQWGRFDLTEVFQMDFTDDEFERFRLEPGDILVCEGGEPGRTAVWEGEISGCCYQKALHRLRPKGRKRGLPHYYLYWATAAFTIFRTYKPTGTKTTIAHLPKEKLEVIEMALPALPEQERIVEILDGLDKRLLLAETRASTLKSLFSSMLHLLMTGQVRLSHKMIALQNLALRRKSKPSGRVPDQKLLDEIVRRIVEAVQPEKIILFGSAARGEMGPDSDVDLLVVKACDSPREIERQIYRRLIGIGVPKDVLVVTPEHLDKHKDTIGYIYRPALREGKVIYAE